MEDAEDADAAWAALWASYAPLDGAPTDPRTDPTTAGAAGLAVDGADATWRTQWGDELLAEAGAGAGAGARRDCGYPGITEAECVARGGCRWDESQLHVPWCFYE